MLNTVIVSVQILCKSARFTKTIRVCCNGRCPLCLPGSRACALCMPRPLTTTTSYV